MEPTWYADIGDAHAVPGTESELEAWLRFKPRCDRVGVEWDDSFCAVELQKALFAANAEFDNIGQTKQFQEGRNKANPFEGIKREIFQNRAVLKLREMNCHCEYLLSQPAAKQKKSEISIHAANTLSMPINNTSKVLHSANLNFPKVLNLLIFCLISHHGEPARMRGLQRHQGA